jgi:hypothetical protein
MAGGNWDRTQNLNNGQVEWPTGPLPLADPTEKPLWVEAWVVQRSNVQGAIHIAGASQRTVKRWPAAAPVGTRWTADGELSIQGYFVPGPALGIALAVGEIPGIDGAPSVDTFYWWADLIDLV